MKLSVQVEINDSKERVWNAISDIENSVHMISGIEKIEVLEKPEADFVGFKWRETRTMFGKEATEVMWITDSVENDYYQTRAESHGSVYISRLSVADSGDGCILTMGFDGEPQTVGAKIMDALTGFIFKSATIKALQKDLEDIKATVEKK